ncbi:MAG: F0F1 ATP synthase subunit epsilon [Anaerolineae bacterium]
MAKLRFELVSPERIVHSDEGVDMVIAPGADGELGILPSHAPLLTALGMGELRLRKGDEEESFAVHGGFLEVVGNKVIVMADVAERADEIDLARAEEARERAERRYRERPEGLDVARCQAALRRSSVRLKVAGRRRRRPRVEIPREEG